MGKKGAALPHQEALQRVLNLLSEGLQHASAFKLTTLGNYLSKINTQTKRRCNYNNSKTWLAFCSLLFCFCGIAELEIASLMFAQSKVVDGIGDLICCNFPKFETALFKRMRLKQLSTKECLRILQSVGMSLVQYKQLYRELKHNHFNIFVSQSKVSTLQAQQFAQYSITYQATKLPTGMGVSLSPEVVLGKVKHWLSLLEIPLDAVLFVLHIDGRPAMSSSFEVFVAMTVIYQGKEVVFPGGMTVVPLLLYEGEENMLHLEHNVKSLVSKLEDLLRLHTFLFGSDASLLWSLVQEKGVCPYCPCKTLAERMACSCSFGSRKFDDTHPFLSLLLRFVLCVLHMKLRIVNHFMTHIMSITHGSSYWSARTMACMNNLGIRWKIYEEKSKSGKITYRVPSYRGNECDKIMAQFGVIIDECVPPQESFSTDWKAPELKAWYQDHSATLESQPANQLKVTLLSSVFDHLRKKHKDDEDSITSNWKSLWSLIFGLLGKLEHGHQYRPFWREHIEQFGSEAKRAKELWDIVYRGDAYHLYEHELLDHGKDIFIAFPMGLGAFSQNSQERANGDSQCFVRGQCFKGAWKNHSPSVVQQEASDNSLVPLSLTPQKYIEQYSPKERQQLSVLGKRKRGANVLMPVSKAKYELLTRQLLLPFIRADSHEEEWKENMVMYRNNLIDLTSLSKHKKIDCRFPIKIVKV
jgi:hypothetical protein